MESWRETFSGEKQTYFIEPFLVRNAYETGNIKNLKNLNIGTDRPMQQRRPRSDAAENKGMKLIWENRGIGLWAFQDRPPSIFVA